MSRNLSTAEVARILGVREARVREFVRSGLCQPTRKGRRYAFTFQDLVVLCAAEGLIQQRVPAARVRRALALIAAELPTDRPLSGLRVFADGRSVAVRDGGTAWNPETGQTLLDFEVDQLAQRVEDLCQETKSSSDLLEPEAEAGREFQRALDLEDSDPSEAREAYQRALELDPELVDAYVNLGRLAHDEGRASDATRLYHEALERSPDDPVIHFNLALALEDTRGIDPAVAHYRRALALDPDFADAHFNLAGLCEQQGKGAEALRHYHAYKKLTQGVL